MKLPKANQDGSAHYDFGRYVTRRLKLAGLTQLAMAVDTANAALRSAARALQDASAPIGDALAARDVADESLDDTARHTRLKLSARHVGADRTKPYTDILPKGIDEYVKAKVGDQNYCYGLLIERIETFLPADDALRLEAVAALRKQLAAWNEASKAVDEARTARALALAAYQQKLAAWEATMRSTYGSLLGERTAAQADRFFPRGKSSRPGAPTSGEAPPAAGPSEAAAPEAAEPEACEAPAPEEAAAK